MYKGADGSTHVVSNAGQMFPAAESVDEIKQALKALQEEEKNG